MRTLLLLFLLSTVSWSQELTLINKTPLQADHFIGFDQYRHLYYLKDGALFKKGDLGEFRFQDFQLGPVTSVDLINPLNVVVFYAQTNTVVFLDNRLNEKERVQFNDLPTFLNLSMAANAGNNRLWVFNMDTQQLQLYNYRNQQLMGVSQPLKGKILSHASNFNDCTLLTEDYIRQVNIYGSLVMERPSEEMEAIAFYDNTLVGLKEQQLFFMSENGSHRLDVSVVEKPIKDLQLTQDFLYIYDHKTLYAFHLTQPK